MPSKSSADCWSYSKLTTFEDCPYRYYLRYVEHLEPHDRFFASYGSLAHKLLEKHYKTGISGDELYLEYLFSFQNEVKGERPGAKIAEKYFNDAANYFRDFRPLNLEVIDVEKRVGFELAGKPFVGVIDLVGKRDDGCVIVDHKSRNMKPRSKRSKPTLKDMELDKMLRQLYLYAGALKQETGEFPCALCFNCFRTGTVIEEPFRKEAYDEAVNWSSRQIALIENTTDFYPAPDPFTCRYICSMSEDCCYYETLNDSA